MGASITLAGESLIAQKQGAQQILDVARFVLANVPGLDTNAAVDRAAGKPPAAQIVYTANVNRKGYVSPRQVIYSLMVGSDIGDWDFNWIGLETAEGVLLAVAYVPIQQKRKNIPPLQIGNNITRNFLVEFNGAQALTGLVVDASTWQHDFTVRLNGIDERERLSNRDIFGRACFLGTGLQMERNGFGLYQLKAGVAYVEGVRVFLTEPVQVQLPALPAKAWLDVALVRVGSDVVSNWTVVFGADRQDYQDSNGVRHYLVELASVAATAEITDQRASQPITVELVKYFAARDGDYEGLRARSTTKEDVDLGNLPNAKSDDPGTDSSDILATTKALNALRKLVDSTQVGLIGSFAMITPPDGWLRANGAAVSRTVYAALFAKIGTTYGAGDGVSTFNLPDPRGKFVRVLDDGRGLDAGRVLGSSQADDTRSHSHTGSSGAAGGHSHTGGSGAAGSHAHTASADVQGNHSHTVNNASSSGGVYGSWYYADTGIGADQPSNVVNEAGSHSHNITVNGVGDHAHTITINAVGDHSHAITINATGGSETRPTNIAFLACIKY